VTLRLIVAALATAVLLWSLWTLERARTGLTISSLDVGTTPATVYRTSGTTDGPIVIVAHGFAGSQQLMKAYALTLAQAGYIAVTYDLLGHGANPVPMSGDVNSVDGTTRLLVAETLRVSEAAREAFPMAQVIAFLAHSMASDIVVRAAIEDGAVEAVIGISPFSAAVTALEPPNYLVIAGEWEAPLVNEGIRVLHLTDAEAGLSETVGDFALGTARRVVASPNIEHVGILYAHTALEEARLWLDIVFDRPPTETPVVAYGLPILGLMLAVTALVWPISGVIPKQKCRAERLSAPRFLATLLAVSVATPVALSFVDTRFLPVLVADYLAVHFLFYGVLTVSALWIQGARPKFASKQTLLIGLALAAYGIFGFGTALDRYVASFSSIPERIGIIAAIAVGAVPYMLSDAMLTEAGRAPLWRTLLVRSMFLVSLSVAVALDFERLFFLILIMLVIVLFFLVFGTLGGIISRRIGSPGAAALGNGLTLAWALGVTFPLFVP
jgi:pimeloyl-ACP methyl ester carboxylesterase